MCGNARVRTKHTCRSRKVNRLCALSRLRARVAPCRVAHSKQTVGRDGGSGRELDQSAAGSVNRRHNVGRRPDSSVERVVATTDRRV
ncbi:hypothetical protein J6590_053096 [Homalodisca vitripennis]|nr:hypothetical protein J6590_053096 [Homalodisca vitripennis]